MSIAAIADKLLETRGDHRSLDAFVVATAFDRTGAAAFALGDGTIHLARRGDDWIRVEAHDGAALALAADPARAGFVTGGDDGALRRVAADGGIADIQKFGMKWVEQLATHRDDKAPLIACSVGKRVHLLDPDGAVRKIVEHPSTVTGLAFDAKGKRFGASHYGGASLWFVNSKTDNPRKLEWKGSHTGIVISPDGENVVTSMQESALHGWRLSDNQHMRMSGYPSKTAAMSFSRGGKWLATSGAESVVLWPFTGGGPTGKAPTELAGGDNVICTYVACHPQHDNVAAGFSDGLVVLADFVSTRVLPVCAPGRGAISALSWSDDGTTLALGSETGFAALVDFSKG